MDDDPIRAAVEALLDALRRRPEGGSPDERERMLSIPETAKRLGVSATTVRQEVSAGRLPAHRLGSRCVRIKVATVEAYLIARQIRPAGWETRKRLGLPVLEENRPLDAVKPPAISEATPVPDTPPVAVEPMASRPAARRSALRGEHPGDSQLRRRRTKAPAPRLDPPLPPAKPPSPAPQVPAHGTGARGFLEQMRALRDPHAQKRHKPPEGESDDDHRPRPTRTGRVIVGTFPKPRPEPAFALPYRDHDPAPL